MLRRRAAALLELEQVGQAATDFDQAFELVSTAHGTDKALFVRVEQAGLLLQHNRADEAERVARAIEVELATEPASPHFLAEFHVLRARLARTAGNLPAATEDAERARQAALEAVAPVSYFAAATELAEALEGQGDRPGAYGVLATAWATLSDVLGEEAASSWVEPCLLGYQIRWGGPAFQQAKTAYEARRRATLKGD